MSSMITFHDAMSWFSVQASALLRSISGGELAHPATNEVLLVTHTDSE